MAFVEEFLPNLKVVRISFTLRELEALEWSGNSSGIWVKGPCCPVCGALKANDKHTGICWIDEALKEAKVNGRVQRI